MQRAWKGGPRSVVGSSPGLIQLGPGGSGLGWLAGERFGSACGLTRCWKSGVTHANSNF